MKSYIAILMLVLGVAVTTPGQAPVDEYFANEVKRSKPFASSAKDNHAANVTAPVNDNFTDAKVVSLAVGGVVIVNGNNISGSKEASEPNHAENVGGSSVWYKYTSPATQNIEIRTVSASTDFDTTLAVYKGSNSLEDLDTFAYNDDCYAENCNTKSRVQMRLLAGETYYIAVDGYNGGAGAASGSFVMLFESYAFLAFDNNSIDLAYDLGNAPAGSIAGSTGLATIEAGEPAHANGGTGAHSVWYRYKSPSSRAMTFEMRDFFASEIAVYESPVPGPVFAQLTKVDSSADTIGFHGGLVQTTFFAKSDKYYFIAIDWNDDNTNEAETGTFQLKFYQTKFKYSFRLGRWTAHTSLSVFRPDEATFYTADSYHVAGSQMRFKKWGLPGDEPLPADCDGDGITDYNVVRNQGGKKYWYCFSDITYDHTVVQWGLATDKAITGDFDRDGVADQAVIRNVNGTLHWYVLQSSNQQFRAFAFGSAGDKPVLGDFDGDGATDVAVTRSEGNALKWHVLRSGPGLVYTQVTSVPWGLSSDKPVAEDYDGDGKTDIAVFRPIDGGWHILRSSDSGYESKTFGLLLDTPQPGDYNNDGKADIAFFRAATGDWHIWLSNGSQPIVHWGGSSDTPVTSLARLSQ